MKKLLLFVLALIMTVSALTACKSNNDDISPVPKQYLPQIPEGGIEMLDSNIVKSTITSTDDGNGNYSNPVIFADVPDIDFIRVDRKSVV